MKKRLITSALPYVNNVPHLGNLIQVLSADVFARFCRQYGYETLYVCGTDEYGTATETRALEEGISPQQLCDRYHRIHMDIYKWFEIDFDHFGRTSLPVQTEIVQNLFKKVDEAGFINQKELEQLYCEKDQRFLADRYVHGECPRCGYEEARGDQCENCGKLLDPTELIEPRCGTCGKKPVIRKTKHLYLDLPSIRPILEEWMKETSVKGFWAKNAISMTESWIRDGLKERAITRDLKWGIPVPKEGFEEKVFYVWFDAPIGYISITANLTDNWESWWRDPDNTLLYQFIGKDNIPFHTVIFPCAQLASGEVWTKLHHMSSTEYLNYESGKFSKSKGIGVFGNDCRDTGIPSDVWRFYIYYNRPENSDYQFTWADFQERVNSELIGNFANLINRTLSFLGRFYNGTTPDTPVDADFWNRVIKIESQITEKLDHAQLRSALKDIFALSDMGNKAFQAGEPWRTVREKPDEAGTLIKTLSLLVRDLAILIKPYLPTTSRKIFAWMGIDDDSWSILGSTANIVMAAKPEILFERLEDARIQELRTRFSGPQVPASKNEFYEIELRSALIRQVENHPNADKLYVITLDTGNNQERTICSGLVEHYRSDELEGKTIILVSNLKPAKFRGISSNGMLLAAEDETGNLEVITIDTPAGERIIRQDSLQNINDIPVPTKTISIDRFFESPITATDGVIMVERTPLIANGQPIRTRKILNGKVG